MIGEGGEELTKELTVEAKIQDIFQSFGRILEEMNPCENVRDEHIQTAIKNVNGPAVHLFAPEVSFKVYIQNPIAKLLGPSRQCLHSVHDALLKMSHAYEDTELQRFPVLRRQLIEITGNFWLDRIAPCEKMINDLIQMEMHVIATSHLDFMGKSQALEMAMLQLRSPQVYHSKCGLLQYFIQKLYRADLFKELPQERDELVVKRQRTSEKLRILQQAIQSLSVVESDMELSNLFRTLSVVESDMESANALDLPSCSKRKSSSSVASKRKSSEEIYQYHCFEM